MHLYDSVRLVPPPLLNKCQINPSCLTGSLPEAAPQGNWRFPLTTRSLGKAHLVLVLLCDQGTGEGSGGEEEILFSSAEPGGSGPLTGSSRVLGGGLALQAAH
jgi:hypothetical protein